MSSTYQSLFQAYGDDPALKRWASFFQSHLDDSLSDSAREEVSRWKTVISELPHTPNPSLTWEEGQLTLSPGYIFDKEELTPLLMKLHPWRKGPYKLGNLKLETEWRSDLKWNRIQNLLPSFEGKHLLDIGCGNGYHLWHMLNSGAKSCTGIDPYHLFNFQFQALSHFAGPQHPLAVLPFSLEDLAHSELKRSLHPAWDVVFSMGVLYHRRSPLDHLSQARNLLKRGGELILETLTVTHAEHDEIPHALVPPGRYAKMKNVYFLPNRKLLEDFLAKSGFTHIEHLNTSATSPDEQRQTPWMTFESLEDYLDPNDPSLTIEGHPAPQRSVYRATKG